MNAPVIASVAVAAAVGAGLAGFGAYKAIKRKTSIPAEVAPATSGTIPVGSPATSVAPTTPPVEGAPATSGTIPAEVAPTTPTTAPVEVADGSPATSVAVTTAPVEGVATESVAIDTRAMCPDVTKARGFDNPRNLCYMNTVLLLLLVVFRQFTHHYVYRHAGKAPGIAQAMQAEEAAMVDLMQGGSRGRAYCTNILNAINASDPSANFQNAQDEPLRVLISLLNTFDIQNTVHEVKGQEVRVKREPLLIGQLVENATVASAAEPHVNRSGWVWGYVAEESPPLLVVLFSRVTYQAGRPVKVTTPLVLSPTIGDKALFAIIVHLGETPTSGHYAAFFKYPYPEGGCEYMWYYYDDMVTPHIQLVGGDEQLTRLHANINPVTNGVLFFYWDERYGMPMDV